MGLKSCSKLAQTFFFTVQPTAQNWFFILWICPKTHLSPYLCIWTTYPTTTSFPRSYWTIPYQHRDLRQGFDSKSVFLFRNGLSPPSENPSSLNHPAEQPLLPAASSTVQKNDGSPSTHNVSFTNFQFNFVDRSWILFQCFSESMNL